MTIRSWLFCPGDSTRKLEKLAGSGADAVVLDLEDSVAPQSKPAARDQAVDWLSANRHQPASAGAPQRWVRINAINTPWWRDDLTAVMMAGPDGIFLPKTTHGEQLQMLNAELNTLEARGGLPSGSVKLVPQLAETAASALAIGDFVKLSVSRLAGFNWGSEDLASALGASRERDEDGHWTDVFRLVRATLLLAAHARGVQAIDTVHTEFRNLDALKRVADASSADGFTGMLAIHPQQVPIINAAFSPNAEQLADAREIVAAFSANPAVGALSIKGRLVEQPHLEQARRVLARAG